MLNKCDLLTPEEKGKVLTLLRELNPTATVHETVRSRIDLKHVINTGRFSMDKAGAHKVSMMVMMKVVMIFVSMDKAGARKVRRSEGS